MSIINTIYQTITEDTELGILLAKDPVTNAAAIYETWAHETAEMPYIVQTHEQRRGNHFAKTDALAIFDIFTDQGTINAEVIRNELLNIFDQNSIESENGEAARFYYSRDQEITGDPENEVTHWQIVFNVQYWRKAWLAYKSTPVIAGALEGSIDSISLSAAELAAIMKIASGIISNSAAIGNLSIEGQAVIVYVDIVAAANSESSAYSSLSTIQPLSATINNSSAVGGKVDTQKGVFLQGAAEQTTTLTTAMQVSKKLGSGIEALSNAVEDLNIVRTILADNEAITAITSDLSAIRKVSANNNSNSVIAAELGAIRKMGTINNSNSIIAADMSIVRTVSSNIDAISDAGGILEAAPQPIPKTISNLGVWYDADKLQFNNNDLVTTWTDESGNNRHLTAAGDDRPTFITNNINGLPAMNFNKKVMTVDFHDTLTQPHTIFMIAKTNVQEEASLFFFDGILNSARHASYRHTFGRMDYFGGATKITTFYSTNDVYYIYRYVFNGANSTLNVDGVAYEGGDIGSHTLTGLTLNASYSSTIATRLNANYAEFLMYEKVLTTQEINTIENYLSAKYAILQIPQKISGLEAWYDASKLTLNNNDLVSTWTDSSGNERHLTSSGADRPTFKTNDINGMPAVQFIQKNMTVDFGATFSQPNTILFVVKQIDTSGTSRFFFDGIISSARHSIFKHSSGRLDINAGLTLTTSYSPSDNTYFLGNILFNEASSIFRRDGEANINTGNVGTHSLTGFKLGSNVNGAQRLDCHIAEILIYSKELTTTERDDLESYLKNKYNIV